MELQQVAEGAEKILAFFHLLRDWNQLFRRSLFVRSGTRLNLSLRRATAIVARLSARAARRRGRFLGRRSRSFAGLILRLLLRSILPAAGPTTSLRRLRPLGAGCNHCQRNATPLLIDRRHPGAN